MRKFLSVIVSFLLLSTTVGCLAQSDASSAAASKTSSQAQAAGTSKFSYESYRDIPGITQDEIAAVDTFLQTHPKLIFGVPDSSYAFVTDEGELGGYYQLLSAWLSDLFDTSFELKLYSFQDLKAGLLSGEISLAPSYLSASVFEGVRFDSTVVSQHAIRYISKSDSISLREQATSRSLIIGYLQDGNSLSVAREYLDRDFNKNYGTKTFLTKESAEAALTEGRIDLFVADGTIIDTYKTSEQLFIGDFTDLVYQDVTVMSCLDEMKPFISVLDKALEAGALYDLNNLAKQGLKEYYRTAFYESLTPAERSYYGTLIANGGEVSVGIKTSNYPFDYYDEETQSFQGISIDVLAEISAFTNLSFVPANPSTAAWSEILDMLENDEIPMVAELSRIPARETLFVWADAPFTTDAYALVSRTDYPNITIDGLRFTRVGLLKDTAYAEAFTDWFHDIAETKEYADQVEALDALAAGEIDLLMTTKGHYTVAVNYLKRTDFKLNYIFDNSVGSYFGFHKDETLLAGIISKAQVFVNTSEISQVWMFRVYNYQEEARRTQNLIWSALIALLVIALVIMILMRRRNEQRLQALVDKRTDELNEQIAETESASKAKSTFLALMSHEMRTPLNAIIGLSHLSLDDNVEPEEVRDNTERIYNSGVTLLHIVNDILDISKIEAGRMEIIPVKYDTASLINDTITLNILRIGDKPITFNLVINGELPAYLMGDELRVKQIMNNLLSNAFKYTKEGTVDWSLSCERDGDDTWLVATIKDSGIGIQADDIDKLFSDYNQVDTKANRAIEGTGLGLAITKKMVELMDGTIEVESTYGEGTTFIVRLRQGYIDDQLITASVRENLTRFDYTDQKQRSNSTLVRISLPNARVLVVDDVQTNLVVARGLLKPYGMQVDCVTSGADAVKAIRDERIHYDAIFMDHMMPGMDGIEATQLIRTEIDTDYARNIPIIAMTANAVMGNEEMFLANGFNAFLAKPIEVPKLDDIVRKWVRDSSVASPQTPSDQTPDTAEKNELFSTQNLAPTSVPRQAESDFYNWEHGLSLFSGDEESLVEVLEVYTSYTPPLLVSLETWSEDTLKDYAITVHGVKGSSNAIGATAVGSLAEALEHAAKRGDAAFIREHEQAFLSSAYALIEEFKRILGARESVNTTKPLVSAPDPVLLVKLAQACRQADIDLIDETMEQLDRFEYEAQTDLITWIHDELDQVHFRQIAERLEAL